MSREAFAYTLIAAGANVAGAAAVASRARWTIPALEKMIALSAGFMVSVALLDLIPESIEQHGKSAGLLVLLGFLLVHLTQHALTPHFHFGEERHEVTVAISASALVGLLLHTFVDGVAIASSFAVGTELGVLVFVAILLHKLPEGLAISSLFLASGSTRAKALGAGAALGLSTIIGGLLTSSVGVLGTYGLPVAAGVTLYVAASNLVPEFQARHDWSLQGTFFGGCALYFVARNLIGIMS